MSCSAVTSFQDSSGANSFKEIIRGEKAFYKQANYHDRLEAELQPDAIMSTTYTCNFEKKIDRIAKQIFSYVFFPVALYTLIHGLIGKIVVIASLIDTKRLDISRMWLANGSFIDEKEGDEKFKYKRFRVFVDGYAIDAMIAGKESTFKYDRWMLVSHGNGETYESDLSKEYLYQLMTALRSNVLVFNYPGVGKSTGLPNRKAMEKAYRAMLTLLEDEKTGIGAKEIIGYGHSLGCGVQGCHPLPKKKYVFVKSRTFSDLATVVSHEMLQILGFFIKIFGWNINIFESSKKLQAREIILQTTEREQDGYAQLNSGLQIVHDGVIPAEASLAKALLDDPTTASKKNKQFIGIPETHNEGLRDPGALAEKIEDTLAFQSI